MNIVEVDDVKNVGIEIVNTLSKVIIGYRDELLFILTALLANGHVLLEGVPGIAKTTLARGLTKLLGIHDKGEIVVEGIVYKGFSRIQFTPDLMPSDITGSLIFNPLKKSFEPRLGPIFAYIVLADEINRATPRTQSALLQAMQEREVTIGDKTYPLEIRSKKKFFFVIATQNPIEQEGTYPLPEAQLDRFLMRIVMDYPSSLEDEKNIYRLHAYRLTEPIEDLEPITKPEWIIDAQEVIAKKVLVSDEVLDYLTRLIRSTRPEIMEPISKYFELGASPRAGISLLKAAKAYAALRGSSTVEIDDVDKVLFPVLNHRVIPNIDTVVERGGTFKARINVIKEGLDFLRKNLL